MAKEEINSMVKALLLETYVLTQWSLQKENLMSTCKKLLLQIVMAPQQH